MKINLTMSRKLSLSFLLIISVFSVAILYSTNFIFNTRERYDYLTNYILQRNFYLTHIQGQIRSLASETRSTFNNPQWIENATPEDFTHVQNFQLEAISAVHRYINSYQNSITYDQEIEDIINRFPAFSIFPQLAQQSMYNLLFGFELFVEYFDIERLYNQNVTFFEPVDNYSRPAIESIEALRDLNLSLVAYMIAEIQEDQNAYLQFLISLFIATLFISGVITYLIISNFQKRIGILQKRSDSLKNGDFLLDISAIDENTTDEIGNVTNSISSVLNTFMELVQEINRVSVDINIGIFETSIDENKFNGGFQFIASEINKMAIDAIQASSFLAQDQHYQNIRKIMDILPLVITFHDKNFDVVDCNEAALGIYGLSSKEEYINNFYNFSPEYQPDGSLSKDLAKEKLTEAYEKGYLKLNWMHIDKKGDPVPSEVILHRNDFSGDIALFGIATDLRDQQKLLEETKKVSLAEGHSKAKSRFLAKMSHEIRTPLNAILGVSEINLQNSNLPLHLQESFINIHSSSKILLGIINDILDLAKIEENKIDIVPKTYDTVSLINDILQLHVFRIGSNPVSFIVDIDENIPVQLIGDELRIKQIVNNILSNAFKYTHSGQINFKVESTTKNGNPALKFIIKDTGIGMTKDEVDNIHIEFTRFNKKVNRAIEGSGLGMSIVMNLLDLMDSEINIESQVNIGTNIEVVIPQMHITDDVIGKDLSDNLQNFILTQKYSKKMMNFIPEPMPYGRVLVVDDIDTNLFVAKGLLSFYDLNIETCTSGYTAIELVTQGNVYDIIFMDQMMPDIDGIKTCKIIRDHGYSQPIVALTANALIGQSDVFLTNGFDGFISKPIDVNHLNNILNKFIRDKQPEHVLAEARTSTPKDNDMWNYFTGEKDQKNNSSFNKSIRQEFSRTQKNAVTQIRKALDQGNTKDSERHAHTLKGLARMIDENHLADTAKILEDSFSAGIHNDETEKHLKILEEQLTTLLDEIKLETPSSTEQNLSSSRPSFEDISLTLEKLEEALADSSMRSIDIAKDLEDVPEAAILVYQVKDFEFEEALKNLHIIKEILQ